MSGIARALSGYFPAPVAQPGDHVDASAHRGNVGADDLDAGDLSVLNSLVTRVRTATGKVPATGMPQACRRGAGCVWRFRRPIFGLQRYRTP